MSVRDCLDKLVATGTITRRAAADADALWRRYQRKFSLDMPPARADAAAALQAAREMQAASRQQKNSVAMQVLRQTTAERDQMAHPWGAAAGGMAILTRDIYRTGAANVETRATTIRETLMAKFNEGAEAYKSTMAGLKKDTAGVRNMVAELFGVDTGDHTAKAAAKGWIDATTYGVKYVQSAGKIFEENENWRLPQFWSGDRVRRFGMGNEFRRDIQDAVDNGGLAIFDKERLEIATDPARITALIEKSARDIITEGGSGSAFSKEQRTFNFTDGKAGFDAWSTLQEKYGSGSDIISTLTGHLNSMAQEAALVDLLGPQHASTVAMLMKNARSWEKEGKPGQAGLRPARMLGMESANAIDRTYNVLNGRANGIENQMWGGVLGSLRSLMSASSLGSAIIPATIGDSVTALLAARGNGLEGARVLARVFESGVDQADAARLLVTGHAMSDHAISSMRYQDQYGAPELLKRVSDFVIRASGLTAWTEALKKAFTMEFLGFIAKSSAKGFADLDQPFADFLSRYRISPAEWDTLRTLPQQDIRGAKFFDSSLATTDETVRKLYEGVLQERALAVLEPDARVRAVTTQGARGGTFLGEVARSATMFQSFSMTMVSTWMHGLAIKDGMSGNRAANNALFYIAHLMAGASVVEARQILQGKDPIKPNQPKFWAQAAVQGGGLGFFGDLVGGIAGGADRTVMGKISGPIGSLIDDTAQFGNAVVNRQPGAINKGVQLLRHITPGSNLWFARLAVENLVFNQISRAIDPNYAQSFARREQQAQKAYGQSYYWHPGERLPERPPSFTRP